MVKSKAQFTTDDLISTFVAFCIIILVGLLLK
jgi:hypothetical protein